MRIFVHKNRVSTLKNHSVYTYNWITTISLLSYIGSYRNPKICKYYINDWGWARSIGRTGKRQLKNPPSQKTKGLKMLYIYRRRDVETGHLQLWSIGHGDAREFRVFPPQTQLYNNIICLTPQRTPLRRIYVVPTMISERLYHRKCTTLVYNIILILLLRY